jgi:hypothetical protein
MFAYISVVPHPFFAVTDTNGVFRIPAGLPAGRYGVLAAHLKSGTSFQDVIVSEGAEHEVNFRIQLPARQTRAASTTTNRL